VGIEQIAGVTADDLMDTSSDEGDDSGSEGDEELETDEEAADGNKEGSEENVEDVEDLMPTPKQSLNSLHVMLALQKATNKVN
jgi:hypothetical protein